MENLDSISLDNLLNSDNINIGDNSMNNVFNPFNDTLFEKADVDVTITKEETNEDLVKIESNEEIINDLSERDKAMDELSNYETQEVLINKLTEDMSLLQVKLDAIIAQVKLENKELIDSINDIANRIEVAKGEQDRIKTRLLPLQRVAFLKDNSNKTLKYNKVQSTYIEATEKNQFDLKKFRDDNTDFWNEHLEILKPYSKITEVSDYLKITISKK